MMPLPQLLDGLGRERLEVVQKALTLHCRAFRMECLRDLLGGASSLTEEHVTRMAVLFETLVNYSKKADKSPVFRQSVVSLTIDHLKSLVEELGCVKLTVNSVSIQQKKAVLELLNFHLNHFQSLKEQISIRSDTISGVGKFASSAVHSKSTTDVLTQNLSSKTDEDVVRHALLSADAVACAQQVLLSRGGRSLAEVTEYFQSVADVYINELLNKKQIDVAKDVLHNTDRDIWPTLKALCLNTLDSNIRDYLAFELNSISLLEPVELDSWKFLILVESIVKTADLKIYTSESCLKISETGSMVSHTELSISHLLKLPSSARSSLLNELYIKTLDGTLEPMLVKDDFWSHLLSSNHLEILTKWIYTTCQRSSEELGAKSGELDRLSTFLSTWDVTQEMIDFIPTSKCSPVVGDCLLDCLSKFGLYTTEESNNIHKLLSRAIHTGRIFNKWDYNTKKLFVELCITRNMPDLLVSCDIKTDLQSIAWLELYSSFRALKNDLPLKSVLYSCIEYSANYLKLGTADDICLSLALSLFSDQTLREVLSRIPGGLDESENNGHLLHKTLNCYPQLMSYLMDRKEQIPTDISLQLLLRQKFSSNSCHHILKQQSLCSMFKDWSEEAVIDFSHETTGLLYGHNETLDFQFYLKLGRPCHAAMLVLAEVIRIYGKPSKKLLKRGILAAHELAYVNMTDHMVMSSCIAFIEMLGEPSLTLRTNTAVVKQILSFNSEDRDKKKLDKDNCEHVLHQFLAEISGMNVHDVFELLLCCLPLEVNLQGLAVQFAHIHKLPLPKSFLVYCTQRNDWLTFLLYCQIYSYPPDVVKSAVKQFKPVALREHFQSFLSKYSVPERTSLKVPLENLRYKVVSWTSISDASVSKELDHSPSALNSASMEAPATSLLPCCMKDNLFGVLLACHNCADPAEALLHTCVEMPCPVLAVLAEFYKAHAEAQLAAWLASWLPQEERINFECWQKNVPWPSEIIEAVILRSSEMSCSNLLTGFKIFIPDHPLVLVLEVIQEFPHQDPVISAQILEKFKTLCSTLENNEEDFSGSWCLSNSLFTLNIGIKVLLKYLACLPSVRKQREFLQILYRCSLPLAPEGSSIDISKLLVVLDVLSSTEVAINIENYVQNSTEEIRLCSEKLEHLGMYKEASDLGGNQFVVAELVGNFRKWLNGNYQDFKAFCSDCNSCFEQASIDPLEASTFFHKCAFELESNVDRWRALHNAVRWYKRSVENDPQYEFDLEKEMWQCCIDAKNTKLNNVLAEELQHSPLKFLCSKELDKGGFTFSEQFHLCDKFREDQMCSCELMDKLLDIGDLASASQVQTLFQVNHMDFEILRACIELAESKLTPQEIPTKWALSSVLNFEDTLETDLHRSNSKNDEQVYLLDGSDLTESLSHEKFKVLSLLQQLSKLVEHGEEIGKQIVTCYRLSFQLGLSYKDVIAVTDPLKLLRAAMSQTHTPDYSLASDITIALRLSPSECAKFLSREIIAAISKGPAPGNVKVFLLWGQDIEQHFQQLWKWVPDPSLLGNELMNMIHKLTTKDKNIPKAVLTTTAELLVRAHDCYAAACHMEGISLVLHTVNNFTAILKTCSEWALMVRLLTGIQRYTEMNYIFKILKESDHFEFLLRKDSVKPLGFKLALLDWLRRECPLDTGLLKMTAAHFQMHQQEAELWQKDGYVLLGEIVELGLLSNQKTKGALQMAMQNFSHASECYLQANMLNHAMTCAYQAELVALQLFMLSCHSNGSILRVILLDSKSVSKLIISTLSFNHALVVARAYNHRADWAAALYYHCVSPGLSAEEYFTAWSSSMELTPAIVQNIAYRLQRTSGVTRDMNLNMQWLLGHVKDMDVRYKIASELGFKEMVELLLQAPEVAYLKDTVWQKGFKP